MKGFPTITNNLAELYALLESQNIAAQPNLTALVIHIDSQEIIRMLKHGHLLYDNIICECRSLMTQLGNPAISHSFREKNQVANLLAKEGAKKKLFGRTRILKVSPVFVNDAL